MGHMLALENPLLPGDQLVEFLREIQIGASKVPTTTRVAEKLDGGMTDCGIFEVLNNAQLFHPGAKC